MRISDWSSDVVLFRSDRLRPFAFEPGGPEFASPEYATRMRKASPPVARALRLADGSHFALQYHGPGIKRPPVKAESLRDFIRRLGNRQSLHRLTERRIAILLAGGWRFAGRANRADDLSLGRSKIGRASVRERVCQYA